MTKVIDLNARNRRVYLRGLETKAEGLGDRLARITEVIDGVAWALDSAASSLRKDEAGYRTSNAANPDGGANYVDGELEKAIADAQALLDALEPARRVAHALASADHQAALDGAACA